MQTLKFSKNSFFYNLKTPYILLFTLCMATRLFTSINYLEDIDSMRFALSILDYNILEDRPHFPGYPIFCLIVKCIYFITNSIQISFSIIGAISIFIIIYFSNLIFKFFIKSQSQFVTILLFLNPLLWNLSNRYMSDLFGLSLLMIITYHYLYYINYREKLNLFYGTFVLGLLAGVRISFFPFFIPIILYFTFTENLKNQIITFIILLFGVLIWLIPLVIITDINELYQTSIEHVYGHFYKWGGSVITSKSSQVHRFIKTFESIWADGMGSYWLGRHFITIFISAGWILSFYYALVRSNHLLIDASRKTIKVLIMSIISYFVWILLFQNVVYKPRHIIPFIPFIVMLCSIGLISLTNRNKNFKIFIYSFFTTILILTSYLNYQHASPSAISQIKDYVVKDNEKLKIFYSSGLINKYMMKHNGTEDIIFKNLDAKSDIINYYRSGFTIYSTSKLNIINMDLIFESNFYHNPYVNRLWPIMQIFKYKIDNVDLKLKTK